MRRILRAFGWTTISLGAFTLYFLAYQLVGTNSVTGQAQAALGDELAREWAAPANPRADRQARGKAGEETPVAEGKAWARIRIPRISLDQVVVEGTGRDDLRKGPGHISSTVMPGEPGTFAVSGHRVTYGGPFFNLDKLEPGDQIVIETRHALYTYRMTKRRIVAPTEVSVLDDVRGPDGSLEATIVLTTCNPRGSARQRMIIFGKLASTRPAARSPT